jgi:hypothetical protein
VCRSYWMRMKCLLVTSIRLWVRQSHRRTIPCWPTLLTILVGPRTLQCARFKTLKPLCVSMFAQGKRRTMSNSRILTQTATWTTSLRYYRCNIVPRCVQTATLWCGYTHIYVYLSGMRFIAGMGLGSERAFLCHHG